MEARSSRVLDPTAVPLKRKPVGNVWAKLVQIVRWLVVFAICALLVVGFFPVFQKTQGLRDQKEEIKKQIALEQARNRELSREFDMLKNNPDYIERIARDKLNLGKPNEMIFRFDAYPEPSPKPPLK